MKSAEHTNSGSFWKNTDTCASQSNMEPIQYAKMQKIECDSLLTSLKYSFCYLLNVLEDTNVGYKL